MPLLKGVSAPTLDDVDTPLVSAAGLSSVQALVVVGITDSVNLTLI